MLEQKSTKICKKGIPHTGITKRNYVEYYTYRAMLSRCFNKNNPSFSHYGGNGITVCNEWLGKNGFRNFLHDLGKRPDGKFSLDRIDYRKDYSPENCRWATWIVQGGNKSINNDIVGVSKHKQNGGWNAYISVDGRRFMKCFRTKEEAITQRIEWENTLL